MRERVKERRHYITSFISYDISSKNTDTISKRLFGSESQMCSPLYFYISKVELFSRTPFYPSGCSTPPNVVLSEKHEILYLKYLYMKHLSHVRQILATTVENEDYLTLSHIQCMINLRKAQNTLRLLTLSNLQQTTFENILIKVEIAHIELVIKLGTDIMPTNIFIQLSDN